MSNSSLVSYTKISPNRNSPRNHVIDTITIHCVVGQLSAEGIAGCFTSPSVEASCNYGIGKDGRIALIVEEKDRSWCSSSASNDNRAITIECACDPTHPYAINSAVYKSLINLCADICKRNNIKKLLWKADKSLIGHPEKQNMTVHRWFANKACPGDYIYSRLGQIADEVNAKLGVKKTTTTTSGLQGKDFAHLSEAEAVKKIGPIFTAEQKRTGILASVLMAQWILESGYGTTDLAQNANNCFGMKTTLSGNTWAGSVWDGKSKYTKVSKECYDGKTMVDVKSDFRKYPSIEKSIEDHSAYLINAMNGSKKRYEGLVGCTDYKKAITIIKNGGYATDPEYIDKIAGKNKIIEKWNLTQYDVKTSGSSNTSKPKPTTTFKPYKVRVEAYDLNIRTGAGTNYAKTGEVTGPGVFTIVEEKKGKGSKKGWGKLKSGAGWISLDYATKL